QADLLNIFFDQDAKERIINWFTNERSRITILLNNCPTLSVFYQKWLELYLPSENIDSTLNFFSSSNVKESTFLLLQKIVENYDEFCLIYNSALTETQSELAPITKGDLPFFAVYYHDGHLVRSPLSLLNNKIVAGPHSFDITTKSGDFFKIISCLVGKALLLVNVVRDSDFGGALALPHLGSLYTPTAVALFTKMQKKGWFKPNSFPITRVKFNFLDQLENTNTTLNLPNYLHCLLPKSINSKLFAKTFRDKIAEAQNILLQLENENSRVVIFDNWFPKLATQIKELHQQKIAAAKSPDTKNLCSQIWVEIKKLEAEKLEAILLKIVDLIQITNLDYWN
ncbi:MAG: hypothetical protein ACRC37_03365, partial [Lentisphaeria bacterium]